MSESVGGARPGTTAGALPGPPSDTARAGSPSTGLRALLLALTGVTGLVDAASYLGVGHVFVANMTGNVVLLGFALSGAAGLSIAASAVALAGFLAGAVAGGRLAVATSRHRRLWLSTGSAAQTVLVGAAAAATAAGVLRPDGPSRLALLVLLGTAMGLQNATARRLAIPDLTTTVLTQTLTGLAADSPLGGGPNPRPMRRIAAVVVMLGGALVGGALTLHAGLSMSLAVAAVVLALVTLGFAVGVGGTHP
jgi:uncharacterized membrane protein YoaK (UPF0700 family)